MPRVSVILPCYNAARYLPRALDSVRAQTYRDFEIIVIDDGSTDADTLAYLDALAGDVRLVRQSNRGLAGARNRGFEEAAGELVVPLDCDDYLSPDFLDKTLAVIDTDPEVAGISSRVETVMNSRVPGRQLAPTQAISARIAPCS